jgi:hypothetical protein
LACASDAAADALSFAACAVCCVDAKRRGVERVRRARAARSVVDDMSVVFVGGEDNEDEEGWRLRRPVPEPPAVWRAPTPSYRAPAMGASSAAAQGLSAPPRYPPNHYHEI